jgi:hypothetical protein
MALEPAQLMAASWLPNTLVAIEDRHPTLAAIQVRCRDNWTIGPLTMNELEG